MNIQVTMTDEEYEAYKKFALRNGEHLAQIEKV